MAYSADIDALSPDFRWSFDGDFLSDTGSMNLTNTGMATNGPALCEDVTNSVYCNGTGDFAVGASNANTNSALNDLMYGGWFMVSDFQRPPFRIFGDGNATTCFQILGGFGNSSQFDMVRSGEELAVVGNQILVPNRAYHLAVAYTSGNKLIGYVDGVEQTITEDDQGAAAMAARTGNVRLGGSTGTGDFRIGESSGFRVVSGVNAYYNQWATFQNGIPSTAQVRSELFEKGALADVTITNQAGLDALANTVRPNVPCCIRVTGSGTINLTADNVTFDPLASIHVQYTGTGTLNWTNSNGSNASISSNIGGGTLNILNPAQLTLTGLQNPTEVRVFDAGTETEVAGQENVTTGTFTDTVSVASVDIQIVSLDYKIQRLEGVSMGSDQTIDIVQFLDRNYENP